MLWPSNTKLHTVHQCRIINQEVYETIQSIDLESQIIINTEYTPNESQLHEKIKSQPQKTDICIKLALHVADTKK
jgi:hypothetical protein